MSYLELFYPYQRMMMYAILQAIRDIQKKNCPEAYDFIMTQKLERYIEAMGLTGKLKPEMVRSLINRPKYVAKLLREWDKDERRIL